MNLNQAEHRLDGIPNAQITVRAHEQDNGSWTLRVRAIRIVGDTSAADQGSTDTAEWGVGIYPMREEAEADLKTEDCREQIRGVVRDWLRAIGYAIRLH